MAKDNQPDHTPPEDETLAGSDSELKIPCLTILFHPDVDRVGEWVLLPELREGQSVSLSRLEPLFSSSSREDALPLADPHLSRQPYVIAPVDDDGSIRISQNDLSTTLKINGDTLRNRKELHASHVTRGVVLLMSERVALVLHLTWPSEIESDLPASEIVGESWQIVALRRELRRIADMAVPVFIRGEMGTDKAVVAEALHRMGPRGGKAFVPVNVAAFPPSIASAELFGSVKDTSTQASSIREGVLEKAHRGTLFLDEIDELPAESQSSLLRALETGEIQPVGTDVVRRVDVRVMTGSDSDVEAATDAGHFNPDLFERLNGYEVRIPPLRERRDDIGRLLIHFLREELDSIGEGHKLDDPGGHSKTWLPAKLVALLCEHDWLGNVRQLKNAAKQIVSHNRNRARAEMSPGLERLLEMETAPRRVSTYESTPPHPGYRQPATVTDEELLASLQANAWRLRPTAVQLGVSRTSLYALIERCDAIRKATELDRREIESCLERCEGRIDQAVEELRVSKAALERRMKALGLL